MEEKEVYESKKKKTKLASTIILFIFLILSIIAFMPVLQFNLKDIIANINDSSTEAAAAGLAVGLAAAILLVVLIALAIAIIIVDLICLLKSINNRKSSVKWIRITSYVFDGAFSLLILGTIIKIITWLI